VYIYGIDKNRNMNLGLGSTCLQPSGLVELDISDDPIIDIALSEKHGVAVSDMGKVYSWGRSYSGENGKPGSNIINRPS
jgi:alpha-tubulin suppressor-like RCC1 family protein